MARPSKRALLFFALLLTVATSLAQQQSPDVEKVWSQEKAYWVFVKANNLDAYRNLWNANFLGWPFVSPEPARKSQITDWITEHTSKGETLKSYELQRLNIQQTADIVTTTYRVRALWVDKNGAGSPQTTRIIHTWIKTPEGNWQIISGMSAPTNGEGH